MSIIAAVATARAAAGIGIVRISGEGSLAVADKVFTAASGEKIVSRGGYTALYGHVHDNQRRIDEAIALVFRAPKSYTGEDVVELSCHGGLYVVQRVLRAVLDAGAEPAAPGEFTKRAFLNGKTDLASAEAVMGIISADGEAAAAATLNVLDGALSREVSQLAASLVSLSASLAAWVDFPDDEIPELEDSAMLTTLQSVRQRLTKLLSSFEAGRAVTQGVDTVIIGKPNVGKSTLLNLLSGTDRAIVTPVAGTTRDIVEETVRVGDVVLRLADTAGIRSDTDDEIEKIGVLRAKERIDRAELVLMLLEASEELNEAEKELLLRISDKKHIIIVNKCDLAPVLDISKFAGEKTVMIAAAKNEGTDALIRAVEEVLGTADFDTSAPLLITERQRCCVQKALDAVNEAYGAVLSGITADAVNICVDCAIAALLELTGEKASEAVVNEIFRSFCVGK